MALNSKNMAQTVNIFDAVPAPEKKDYFKFEKVGDEVQGTYVQRIDNSIDGYNNPQTLVDLLQADGTVKTVSIRNTKTGLLEELNKVKLGQIVGFKFTGTKDNPGKQPTKFIRLVHDPKFVDQEWLDAQNNPTAGLNVNDIFPDAPAAPVAPAATTTAPLTDADKIREIALLAKTKLGANTSEEVKSKVIDKTGLEFTTLNLDIILEKLKTL